MALAGSRTDVANLALAQLGEKTIANVDDTSNKIAVRCNRMLSQVTEEIQLAIQWQILEVTISPTYITDSYNGREALYQYGLPGDFLDIIRVEKTFPAVDPTSNTSLEDETWYLADGYLISKAINVDIIYKKFSESLGDWSPRMKECIYRKLALELAMPITENPQIEARAEQKFNKAFHEAVTLEENRRQYEKKKRIRYSMLNTRMRSGRSVN